ncbi:MAG TPA: SURF1 family protein [Roseiarcus sp.]|nr:SURF1 family protein [Roseiarcus sp.]
MTPQRGVARTLLWPALFTALGLAILIALGVWQLHRLKWKEALIAEVSARVGAPPVAAPEEAEWASLDPANYEYRHVRVSGAYDFAHQVLVFRALENPRGRYGGPGYLVMTPLRLASGPIIIVNRGFIPSDEKGAYATPPAEKEGGAVEVVGLMRASEPRNWFTPADDPGRGEWFTRDPKAIAAAMKLAPVAPFTIDADAGPDPSALPEGGETILAFPNNHLSYAITWFGIAIALAGVFLAFAWKKRNELLAGSRDISQRSA